jgi:xanthine/uracil/vitamin C permease (AzgA family)
MSKLFRLNKNDLVKGFILAILTAFLTGLYQVLIVGEISVEAIKTIFIAMLTAGVSYLIKNLVSNNNGEILKEDVLDGNGGVVLDVKNP